MNTKRILCTLTMCAGMALSALALAAGDQTQLNDKMGRMDVAFGLFCCENTEPAAASERDLAAAAETMERAAIALNYFCCDNRLEQAAEKMEIMAIAFDMFCCDNVDRAAEAAKELAIATERMERRDIAFALFCCEHFTTIPPATAPALVTAATRD